MMALYGTIVEDKRDVSSAKSITRGQLEDEVRRLKEELERAAIIAVTIIIIKHQRCFVATRPSCSLLLSLYMVVEQRS